jgi:flavin reductase (DIM6/NTAB) family NADH-FMN oxidoreductase RutF
MHASAAVAIISRAVTVRPVAARSAHRSVTAGARILQFRRRVGALRCARNAPLTVLEPMPHSRRASAIEDLQPVARDLFVSAMSRAANGVNVVCTDGLAGREGVTVSSACSVTAEPPSLLACIHHQSGAATAIEHNGVFCLNVLAVGQQRVSEAFAGRLDALEDRFAVARWRTLATGSPVLEDAVAAFDCRVDHMLTEGTHRIFIARVVAAWEGQGVPLVYSRRSYAGLDLGT